MNVVIALAAAIAGTEATAEDRAARLDRHMTVLGVTLEKTTLQEAQRLLGMADLRHNGGDAAASASGECYVGADGTTLALISNSEMGGGTTITEFQLVPRASLADYSSDERYVVPPEHRPRCSALKSLSRSTATQGGLRLGMNIEAVRRLLGDPTESRADQLLYTSEAKVPMTPEQRKAFEAEFFVRGRGVRVQFAGGKVTVIRAWQVTST